MLILKENIHRVITCVNKFSQIKCNLYENLSIQDISPRIQLLQIQYFCSDKTTSNVPV